MRPASIPAPTQSSKPIASARLKEETARPDDEIHEREVWAQVKTDRHGKIVSTDVVGCD